MSRFSRPIGHREWLGMLAGAAIGLAVIAFAYWEMPAAASFTMSAFFLLGAYLEARQGREKAGVYLAVAFGFAVCGIFWLAY